MKNIIDLHIHTNYSDGNLSPNQVIDQALKNGVTLISITDHDTIDAYKDELYSYAKSKNVSIVTGVEISTYVDKIGFHILGYGFDINNKELKEKLIEIRNYRYVYLEDVSCKLNELGYFVNTGKLSKNKIVTKSHIAIDTINNIKNEALLLKHFNHIPNVGEFIESMLNEECPAFVKKKTITPGEAVELIKRAGGIAILAHPVAYKYEDNIKDTEIINLINEIKVDGIETYYIYIDRVGNKINEIDNWNEIAKSNNLMVTIGSDFHKKDGIHPDIGLVDVDIHLDKNILDNIISKLISIRNNKEEI